MSTKKNESATAIQHIDTIIGDVEGLIQNKQDFIGFIIISMGIEFLGSFYDSYPFDKLKQSETRFTTGLKNLFKNKWYKNNATWLFKCFRGPLIHQYRTGENIYLTSVCKNKAPLSEHLKKKDDRLILVLEQFFIDFKDAAKSFSNLVNKTNSLNKQKLQQEYSSIFTCQIPNFNIQFFEIDEKEFAVSGVTSANIVTQINLNKKSKKI